LNSCRVSSVVANIFIVLMILIPPGFNWFLLMAGYTFFRLFGMRRVSISFQAFLEDLGRKTSPILAFWGIVYGYFLTDPLSSAASNFFGVFFLFFIFNLPKLLLKKDDPIERTIFSVVCAIMALSGSVFIGSILSTLENIKNGAYSYEALGDTLWGVLGPLILVLAALIAANDFCEVPILRKRGVTDYAYEKASGSLLSLSFFLGFGGNRILSPLLLILSFILVITHQRPTRRFPTEVWHRMKTLKESFVNRFVDTSIDGRLITDAVLGSATLALLNFRFFGHVQTEPVHILVILLQTIPFFLFLIPRKPFFLPYIASSIGIVFTGIAGLIYVRSWPFYAFMAELSVHFSKLLDATGRGIVAPATFLSVVLYLNLSITVSAVQQMPIDIIRRKMEKAFKQNRLDNLQKMYRSSISIMVVTLILFASCLYPLLLEYRPMFGMLQNGEMVYYDLFWVFFIFFPWVYAGNLMRSLREIHKPIDLFRAKKT